MLPDRVSNPGPLTYESGALPIALRGPASDQITFLITMLIFLDFRAQKFPLVVFYLNPFLDQQALQFGVLNYKKKQHKEGTYKVSGRSVAFSAFYADFCLCPK